MAGVRKGEITVRQPGTGRALYRDPVVGWRWAGVGKRTALTRSEAEELALRLGGIVCLDGVPFGATKPKRPKFSTERAAGEPPDKLTRLRSLIASEDWRAALKLASRLEVRFVGADKVTLERAWEAYARPEFCRELKLDPDALKRSGIDVLKRRWGKP